MNAPLLTEIGAGVYAWIGAGGDSNAGAVITPHGVLVIDTQQSCALAERFRERLKLSFSGPVLGVINTHYHLDHVAGNAAFVDVPIISHIKTMRALERELGPLTDEGHAVTDAMAKIRLFFGSNFEELVAEGDREWFSRRVGGATPLVIKPPTQGFADFLEYRLPADVVRIEYWGPAHCDGDLIIYLEKAGIVFLADLFFHGRFPWFGDCNLDGWIETLDRVLTLEAKTVVPGHGLPTTMKEVAQFRGLLCAVRSAVEDALKAGKSEDAAVREIYLPDYAGMPRYKEWMPFNIRSAYRFICGG